MNIRGLLIGSVAAVTAVSGARAADAIIIAEPEPMEYVRICDVYGAGFFYIPGTETCLKIGGYVRYQMNYTNEAQFHVSPTATAIGVGTPYNYRFWKLARFAPNFDVRSETEWGTLRAYAEVEFDWVSGTWAEADDPFWLAGGFFAANGGEFTGSMQSVNLVHAFIELQTGSGTLLVGKTDNPYARFFDYGDDGGALEGYYGGQIYNSGEVSYTFDAGNGFSAVAALVEPGTGLFEPNIEAGAKFSQDWGSVGAIVGYDNPNNAWGVKGVARVSFDPVSLGVHVMYSSSEAGVYGEVNPMSTGATSRWSVLAHATVQATEKVSVNGHFQWYDRTISDGTPSTWALMGGLTIEPVTDLVIKPEVRYTRGVASNPDLWEAALRVSRNF